MRTYSYRAIIIGMTRFYYCTAHTAYEEKRLRHWTFRNSCRFIRQMALQTAFSSAPNAICAKSFETLHTR